MRIASDIIELINAAVVGIKKFIGVPTGTLSNIYGEDAAGDLVKTTMPNIVTDFTELEDAPSSYEDQAGKFVVVNDNEDGLEFKAGTKLILKTQTDLECDYSDCNFIKAVIEEDEHISVSEMEDFKVYGLLIHNVSDETITITMPELDVKNRAEVEISAGCYIEFSFFADGIRAYWQISEELQ